MESIFLTLLTEITKLMAVFQFCRKKKGKEKNTFKVQDAGRFDTLFQDSNKKEMLQNLHVQMAN